MESWGAPISYHLALPNEMYRLMALPRPPKWIFMHHHILNIDIYSNDHIISTTTTTQLHLITSYPFPLRPRPLSIPTTIYSVLQRVRHRILLTICSSLRRYLFPRLQGNIVISQKVGDPEHPSGSFSHNINPCESFIFNNK